MALDIEIIRRLRPQNQLHYFDTIGSTMNEASRLAVERAPHGTVVLANEQTSGIGRFGRTWESEADAGIYCSVLLRLPLSPAKLPMASLVLGLAVAEAIQQATELACDLRWPNDVLINGRKAAGILPYLVDSYVVAGIGINVNQTSFPPDLRTPATSLRLQANGRMQSREMLVVKLLEAIDAYCSMLVEQGSEAIMRAFVSASSYVLNRRVVIEESGSKGMTAGLDANGFLLVRLDAGQLQTVTAGGVRPVD